LRRIFAGVRNKYRDFARLNLLRRFENYFKKQRIDVISAGQQNVFLRTTLSLTIDELMTILKVVVSRHRLSDVISGIQRRTIQSFDQTDLVFADHGGVIESDREQAGFRFRAAFE